MHLFSAGVHTDAPSSKYRLFNSAIACGSVPDKSLRSFGSAVMLNKQPFGLHGCFPTLAQGLHFQSSGCGSPVPGLHVFETSSGYGVSQHQGERSDCGISNFMSPTRRAPLVLLSKW